MRTLRLVVVDNLGWKSLPQMLEQVRTFYLPIVNLDIKIAQRAPYPYVPKYNSSYPGLSPLAVVDFDWYDENISIPHLADADIVMFATPRPTIPATYSGYMSFANCGPWEITCFAGNESDSAFVNGRNVGNSFVNIMEHELAHVFYRMRSMADANDHTHQYFYGGTPESVLGELSFQQLTFNDQLAELGRVLSGALVALKIISKSRTTIADAHEPAPPAAGLKLYDLAKNSLGKDIATTQDELGCAEAVSGLINRAYGDFPAGILSTLDLYNKLAAHSKFRKVLLANSDPGDIIISPTTMGRDRSAHGHVGIIANYGICSNDSASGLWKENYTMTQWLDYFATKRGFPVYAFRRTSL